MINFAQKLKLDKSNVESILAEKSLVILQSKMAEEMACLYGEARRKSLGDEMKRLLLSEPMWQMKMNPTIQEIISKKVRMIY